MYIRIGIVDDHNVMRDGVKNIIEFNSDYSVIFQASNGKECLDYLEENHCIVDILLLDICMPKLDGFKVLETIKKRYYHIRTIFLTSYEDNKHFFNALDSGVDGYLLKNIGYDELLYAISEVSKGLAYIDKRMNLSFKEYVSDIEIPKEKLTKREKEIITYVAAGKLNKEIAFELEIREETVKNHLTRIFHKLNVSDRTQAAICAFKNHFIDI
ncbi:MAG: response regulator transcription factor [Lachnospiraceae bacterium]|nr:response regulator transcription factor [Lachnospiraceae bacterium]